LKIEALGAFLSFYITDAAALIFAATRLTFIGALIFFRGEIFVAVKDPADRDEVTTTDRETLSLQ